MTEWARYRIKEPRSISEADRNEHLEKLNAAWEAIKDFPSTEMSAEDLEWLRHMEDWTVLPKTTQKIGGTESSRDATTAG